MGIWLGMAGLFWGVTLLFFYMEENRGDVLFRFFDGLLLAYLCFCLLPRTFEGDCFWMAACCLLSGVLIGALLEQKIGDFILEPSHNNWLHCCAFSAAVWVRMYGMRVIEEKELLLAAAAFFGGLFLFIACGGILPDYVCGKERFGKALGGFAGFFTGVVLLYGIL